MASGAGSAAHHALDQRRNAANHRLRRRRAAATRPRHRLERIQRIQVGAPGSDINRLTGSYPFYAGDYGFLTTYHEDRAYEVAFRYAADGSGKIVDISYLPVTDAEVQKSRGP